MVAWGTLGLSRGVAGSYGDLSHIIAFVDIHIHMVQMRDKADLQRERHQTEMAINGGEALMRFSI
jgi:hypothetical protein